jgi:flagellar P-ring protein precursor FlgI
MRAALVGGTLILAPLKAADGQVYALAQGPLSVGGYKYDMNGNVVQKNHPTVASIPSGATVEQRCCVNDVTNAEAPASPSCCPSPTTPPPAASQRDQQPAGPAAGVAQDASGIRNPHPREPAARLTDFLTAIENVSVEPDRRAKVVINERTGTIVSGGDVRISRVAVSQGDLKVTIVTDNSVSQPLLVELTGDGVRSVRVRTARSACEERNGETGFVAASKHRGRPGAVAARASRPTPATSFRSCARSRPPARCTPN